MKSNDLLGESTAHCIFCNQSKKLIKRMTKSDKSILLFLDMDGVFSERLNASRPADYSKKKYKIIEELSEEDYPHSTRPWCGYKYLVADAQLLNQKALSYLDQFIEYLQNQGLHPHIVISSAWACDSALRALKEEVFADHSFAKHIIGRTYHTSDKVLGKEEKKQGWTFEDVAKKKKLKLYNREDQIAFWKSYHGFKKRALSIVFDDAGLRFKINPVQFIEVKSGLLTEDDISKAKESVETQIKKRKSRQSRKRKKK